jgi:hypothetical protein
MEIPDSITLAVPTVWHERFSTLDNGTTLLKFFTLLLGSSNPDSKDAPEFLEFVEQKLGCSIEDLDSQITFGKEDGYAPEDTLLIVQKTLLLPIPIYPIKMG